MQCCSVCYNICKKELHEAFQGQLHIRPPPKNNNNMRKQMQIFVTVGLTCAFTSSFLNISERTSSGSTLKIAFSKGGCKRKKKKKHTINKKDKIIMILILFFVDM